MLSIYEPGIRLVNSVIMLWIAVWLPEFPWKNLMKARRRAIQAANDRATITDKIFDINP